MDTRELVALALNRVSMTPSDQWGLEAWLEQYLVDARVRLKI
jgi:hypothetical protein